MDSESAVPCVQEVVPVFSTVGVYVDPLFDPALLPRELPALEEGNLPKNSLRSQ
ncbi:MAG: hypothetical protein R2688_00940 [Fimbriimonadaceae bacterium]